MAHLLETSRGQSGRLRSPISDLYLVVAALSVQVLLRPIVVTGLTFLEEKSFLTSSFGHNNVMVFPYVPRWKVTT
jgi:hypothetical protein